MAKDSLYVSLNTSLSSLKEIEQLIKNDPGNKKWRYDLSKCHIRIGSIYQKQGNLVEAMNFFMSSLKIMEQLIKSEPENKEWLYEISMICDIVGNLHEQSWNYGAALTVYKYSLNIIEQLSKKDPGNDVLQKSLKTANTRIKNIQELNPAFPSKGLLSKIKIILFTKPGKLNRIYGEIKRFKKEYLKNAQEINKRIQKSNPALNKLEEMLQIEEVRLKNIQSLNTIYELETEPEKEPLGRLNNIYGNMQKAMQGNQTMDVDKKSNIEPQKKSSENVNFAVSFPASMTTAESYILDVWLFLEEHRNKLVERIKEESSDDVKLKTEGPVIIERGTIITARLTIENLIAEPQEKTLIWTGDINNSSFIIKVPENISQGSKIGRVIFYMNGLEISIVHFKVQIKSEIKEDSKLINGLATGSNHKTAFASYASEDRNDVLARVQGLEKAGVDVFLDVRNLRSGDKYEEKLLEKIRRSDVFYLFWSTAAKKSEWVKKEWEYALQNRGIDFISPIPLESPDTVPPPVELSRVLHFNDWTLAYKRSAAVN